MLRRCTAACRKTLVTMDSIKPTEAAKTAPNIRVLSIAPLLAEAIAPDSAVGKRVEPFPLRAGSCQNPARAPG